MTPSLQFHLFDRATDTEKLLDLMTTSAWPYHVNVQPTREMIQKWIEDDSFDGEDNRTFLILDGTQVVGNVRLQDLTSTLGTIDIRIRADQRGKGIGKAAIRWLTDYFFTTFPAKVRLEASTRNDNLAMQRVFEVCGYVREGCLRMAWPDGTGYQDTIVYGFIRPDWQNPL